MSERLVGRPFLIRPSTGHRGRITLFSAAKQRGHDTECREHSAHHEGSMQAGHERLLQRLRLLTLRVSRPAARAAPAAAPPKLVKTAPATATLRL